MTYGSGPHTRNSTFLFLTTSGSHLFENHRHQRDFSCSVTTHSLISFSDMRPVRICDTGRGGLDPSSVSTNTSHLNLSGCSRENLTRGPNNSEGGSSPGMREECRSVKRVFGTLSGLDIVEKNSCTNGVIPVPPEI